MADIYHVICANDDDARKTLAAIKTPAAEKYVAPSFHPAIPAYVVVIDPEDPDELLGLGELVKVETKIVEEKGPVVMRLEQEEPDGEPGEATGD